MTSPTIRLATPEDRTLWDLYVDEHSEATYCHRWAWREVFEVTYRRRCHYLCIEEDGEWRGILPLVQMRGRLSGNCLVSLPYLDQGGLLASSGGAAAGLREAAFDLLARLGVDRVDLRGSFADPPDPTRTTDRFRFVLELGTSEEDLWSRLGGKVRNQVRKSERDGLTTRQVDLSELARYYRVFCRNMRDLGSPVHSGELFRQVLRRFDDDARLYLTEDGDGRAVGGGVAIRFRDGLVVPWASSLFSARPSCPNHSLYWRVLRDGLSEGLVSFDFGRSSTGTGTYRFKKQWGAEAVPLYWTIYDRHRARLDDDVYMSAGGNSRLAQLWSRLPLPLANRVGPLIRGRLPN